MTDIDSFFVIGVSLVVIATSFFVIANEVKQSQFRLLRRFTPRNDAIPYRDLILGSDRKILIGNPCDDCT